MSNLIYRRNYTSSGYTMHYRKPESGLLGFLRNAVYQFRIEMPEIHPSIWRRIQLPTDSNFWDLHVAIQDAMGWLDSHLHHFEIFANPKHAEYKEMKIWAGDKWHPDRFAKDAVKFHDPHKRWRTAFLEA